MKWIFILFTLMLPFVSNASETPKKLYFFTGGVSCPYVYFTRDGLSAAVVGCKTTGRNEVISSASWSGSSSSYASIVSIKSSGASRWSSIGASSTESTCSAINAEFEEINGVCKKPVIPECPDDEYLDEETNTCLPVESCPDSGTFAKKLYGKSGFQGYTVCFSGCVIKATIDVVQVCTGAGSADESCGYDALYTGASCIEGDGQPHPPGYEYPTNPNPQPPTDPTAPLPPDNLPGTPDSTPEPTPTPKPNPNPTPDPVYPDLGDGDSAIVQKIDVSNQYLENIDVGIDNLIQANNQNSKENTNYQRFILGELQSGIGSGGDDGSGDGDGGLNFGEPEFTNPFEDILSTQDIADINQKTDDVKGLINQKINSFKSLVSTPNYGIGGEVQGVVVEANHYGQSIKMEQNFLARSSTEFSTIILLICGIIAFGVVARR